MNAAADGAEGAGPLRNASPGASSGPARRLHLPRFLRAYALPLWRWYVAGTVAVLATNWLGVRVPMELAAGLDALRAGTDGVATATWHIAALGVSVIVCRTLSRVWFFTPGRLAEFRLREDLFAHALRLPPSFYASSPTGDLLARLTSDVTYARAFAGFALLQGVNVAAALVLSVGQMLAMSPWLTLVAAVPIALGFLAVLRGTRRSFALQRLAQRQLGDLSDDLLAAIQGVATIQAFDVEDVFVARIGARADAVRATSLQMARLRAVVFPLLTVAGGVCVWALLALGGPMAMGPEARLTPGELAAFVGLVAYVLMPLRFLGVLVPVFQRTEAALERIHAVLDVVPEVPEGPNPVAWPCPGRAPSIALRGLSFAYPDAPDVRVLHDVHAEIPAGATVGVYGATGSGKTTLLRVLARLHNPPAGTVFIDGVDVTTLDLATWRSHLVVVSQSPFLLGETIRENIGFGAPDAVVEAAARAASLAPDLAMLPDGIDTVVGERGIVLSGGQRQRVALARGLARDAEVVLLDDVLSAVDHVTEQELVRELRARGGARGCTRVLVSHRLSALEHADLILVMDLGRIVDRGTHAALLSRPGPYRDAWTAQVGEGAA